MALIKPQVYAELVREKINGKVRVLSLANELPSLSEFASKGETVHFPAFKYIGDASALAKGDAIPTTSLDQVDSTATIQHFAKGVEIYDIDVATVEGGSQMISESANQMAISMARTLDNELIDEIKTNALLNYPTVADGKKLTQDELLGALNLFGDDQDRENFKGIVVNSVLINSFYAMPLFVDVTKTTSANGNGIIRNGMIGYFTGIPVYVSDKGTLNGLNATSFIIKDGSLGFKLKSKGIDIEESRVASKKKTDIFGDMIFAVKLTDDSGVVVIEKA